MRKAIKVGVDLMGGESSPEAIFDALKKLALPEGVSLELIATEPFASLKAPFSFVKAASMIEMNDHPLKALRQKKNSSIAIGTKLLKEGAIDAFVSLGNTGALVSSAKMALTTMRGIKRPALLALMPTKKNLVAVLDVGAVVEAKPENLVQFAKLGAAFQKMRGISEPKIGLLNIGSEALKGTSLIKDTYAALKSEKQILFMGNIEGKGVFNGDVDVIVTDGFTGNILLKTAEGIVSLILDKLSFSSKSVESFQSLHYTEYPGALLIGVKGIVIKCHGYSSPKGIANAVLGAISFVSDRFVQKFSNMLYLKRFENWV